MLSSNRRKVVFTIVLTLLIPLVGWFVLYQVGAVGSPGKPVTPPFNMSDRIATIKVDKNAEGELVATFPGWEQEREPLTADQFFEEVYSRQVDLHPMFRIADVTSFTSLLWVGFGLLAQAIFAGRMIVQWYASEKAKASVVPNIFWWMSLVGSSMLMIYFIWRKEMVGLLGQLSGWAIYIRNLWMIYGKSAPKCPEDESLKNNES